MIEVVAWIVTLSGLAWFVVCLIDPTNSESP